MPYPKSQRQALEHVDLYTDLTPASTAVVNQLFSILRGLPTSKNTIQLSEDGLLGNG